MWNPFKKRTPACKHDWETIPHDLSKNDVDIWNAIQPMPLIHGGYPPEIVKLYLDASHATELDKDKVCLKCGTVERNMTDKVRSFIRARANYEREQQARQELAKKIVKEKKA